MSVTSPENVVATYLTADGLAPINGQRAWFLGATLVKSDSLLAMKSAIESLCQTVVLSSFQRQFTALAN